MGSSYPVVTRYKSWGLLPRLFQLGLDLGFRSERAFSIWAVLGQVRRQRSCAVGFAPSSLNRISSWARAILQCKGVLFWVEIAGRGISWHMITVVPGRMEPVSEQRTRRILLIPTLVISSLQGSGLPVPEHLLPLSRHPPLCWDIYPIFSIPSEQNVPPPAPTYVLAPLSTAEYHLAVGNVEMTWLQPMATFSSDPSLVP